MQSRSSLSIFLFVATLVALACSTSSQSPPAGTGGDTRPSTGSVNNGGAGAGGGEMTTPGSGGNGPLASGGDGPGPGGQTVGPVGGGAAGGQTPPASGGTVTPGGGIATGGQAGRTAGGTPTAGQAGAGTGGSVAGAAGAQTGPGGTGGGFVPITGGTGGNSIVPGEAKYSMDPGWQFIKQDVSGAEATTFDDTKWTQVSTPHTYNDIDSYRVYNNHASGDTGTYQGPAWYRKHFKIPSAYSANKVIIEFERIKQGAKFYINGTQVGVYDDGVTPCGIDATGKVNFGDTENVLAVKVDNSATYVESTTGVAFQWMGRAFNPNYGGLIGHVWLHLPGKIYQTYPLYNNLKTSGIYIYGTSYANLNAQGDKGDLTVNVEAEVSNESGSAQSATLGVKVIDPATGTTVGTFSGTATSLAATGVTAVKASGPLTGAKLWSDVSPSLYNVVTTLSVGGKEINGRSTLTGFRKVELKGGAGTGGVYVNGRFVYLLGFAQRATNDWAALGQAVPDWLHDYHANMVRGANSNYIRWMHIAPQRADTVSNDKYGVINIAPAGDREQQPAGVQWTQRVNVMRATMIYLRNNPSVFFWEAGNCGVTAAQMKELSDLQKLWDPKEKGGRGLGDRDMADAGGTQYADWFGTMIAYEPGNTSFASGSYFRGYSNAYRDKGPVIEEEDFRDEGFRGIWDDQSPPHFGFKPGPTDTYHWNSETFTTAQIPRLDGWLNLYTIRNTDAAKSRYSGYASIYFSDSNADGRLQSSAVCRVSGKIDSVRLPKEIYYSFRVAGNTQPDIHIIGHWTYPAGTTKTMYVLANRVSSVELFVNGTSKGKSTSPTNHYLYSFPSIAWASGSIKGVGYDAGGQQVCQHEIKTAGAATAIKLTPTTGADGLQADGADVVMYDVEIVDANGQRYPINEYKVDFTMTGNGIWRGGVNADTLGSTNNTYLSTECGINRVFIRSTLAAGEIKLTGASSGLTSGTATVTSKAVAVKDGLL